MEQDYFLEMSQESEINDALAIFLANSVNEEEKQQRESVNYIKGRSPVDFVVEEGSSKTVASNKQVFTVNLPSLGKRSYAAANNIAINNSTVQHHTTGEYIVEYPLLKCRYICVKHPVRGNMFITERM